ncbi:MAG: hypothetical protein H0T89_03150, partial [Deltaproteobacteria bacterium]|nr:hypothetical protein [Deltaproteobacteria bacterium]
MTHELGPAARALLDAAREGLTPPPAALQRVRGKLDASVAASAASGIAAKLGMLAMVAAITTAALVYRDGPRELAMPTIAPPPSTRIEERSLALVNESAPPEAAIKDPSEDPNQGPSADPTDGLLAGSVASSVDDAVDGTA